MLGLHDDFSRDQNTDLLVAFFTPTGIKMMLEENDYCAVDADIQFPAAFIDRFMGCLDSAFLTPICTLYSDIVNALVFKTYLLNANYKLIFVVQEVIDV